MILPSYPLKMYNHAQNIKYRPRTKHIAIEPYQFRKHFKHQTIGVFTIGTKEQIADIFTNPLNEAIFEYLRNELMTWLNQNHHYREEGVSMNEILKTSK